MSNTPVIVNTIKAKKDNPPKQNVALNLRVPALICWGRICFLKELLPCLSISFSLSQFACRHSTLPAPAEDKNRLSHSRSPAPRDSPPGLLQAAHPCCNGCRGKDKATDPVLDRSSPHTLNECNWPTLLPLHCFLVAAKNAFAPGAAN